jgi:transposase-like protein
MSDAPWYQEPAALAAAIADAGSINKLAEKVGVHRSTLQKWAKRVDMPTGGGIGTPSTL